jgi:hypothetical protein
MVPHSPIKSRRRWCLASAVGWIFNLADIRFAARSVGGCGVRTTHEAENPSKKERSVSTNKYRESQLRTRTLELNFVRINQATLQITKKDKDKSVIMKVSCLVLTTALSCLVPQCAAFAAPAFSARATTKHHSISEELGLPCEDECAAGSFPNLPDSIHPGVLSGRAQMDLLNHAKANGKLSLN